MKKFNPTLAFLLIVFFSSAQNDNGLSTANLKGVWKITDVKLDNRATTAEVNCYLCDLYRAGLGLVFSEDGKVNYSNYGNPVPVSYQIVTNTLRFFTETNAELQTPDGVSETGELITTEVAFSARLQGDVLTLVYLTSTGTETYFFTKEN